MNPQQYDDLRQALRQDIFEAVNAPSETGFITLGKRVIDLGVSRRNPWGDPWSVYDPDRKLDKYLGTKRGEGENADLLRAPSTVIAGRLTDIRVSQYEFKDTVKPKAYLDFEGRDIISLKTTANNVAGALLFVALDTLTAEQLQGVIKIEAKNIESGDAGVLLDVHAGGDTVIVKGVKARDVKVAPLIDSLLRKLGREDQAARFMQTGVTKMPDEDGQSNQKGQQRQRQQPQRQPQQAQPAEAPSGDGSYEAYPPANPSFG